MRKLPELVLLAIFMLIISAPLFSSLPAPTLIWKQNDPSSSNASMANILKAAVEFPEAYNQYFNDHYLLHQQQVDAFHYCRYHFLHETIFPNVVIGKQDWLYYTGERNLNDYECTSPFTSQELQTIRQRLLDWDEDLQERGIQFYVVFAPNKETIYPQHLPDQIKPGLNACRIDQVMKTLEGTSLTVLDLRTAMERASQKAQVYHRTDTHWNDTGAVYATREIFTLIQQKFPQVSIPSFDEYYLEKKPFSGDLAGFLPRDDRFVEQETILVPAFQSLVEYKEGENQAILSAIPVSELPSAIIFRDSFCDALIPFLSEHFSKVNYVSSFTVDYDLLEKEKPDIVIFEIAQRYLTVLR